MPSITKVQIYEKETASPPGKGCRTKVTRPGAVNYMLIKMSIFVK